MNTYNCEYNLKYPDEKTLVKKVEADTSLQADGLMRRQAAKEFKLKEYTEGYDYEIMVQRFVPPGPEQGSLF